MTAESQPNEPLDTRPTHFHAKLLEYLKTQESELWDWFASHKVQTQLADSVRLELLKSTYRIERDALPELYELAESVLQKLQHEHPLTLYQAQNPAGLNAAMAWSPDEVHVVLHGPVLETLSEAEQKALLAHEIAHHLLFTLDDGAFLIADQILSAMLNDRSATASHETTWKHFKLYTELYCDRIALLVTDDVETCVSALVKMETGLRDVSAAAYLKQAAEVLKGKTSKTDGVTHPEMFIRAHAIQLAAQKADQIDATLSHLIEGPLAIDALDLLRQQRLSKLTQQLLHHFLAPEWMRTDSVLAHARQFFETFEPTDCGVQDLTELQTVLKEGDEKLADYIAYVLLDFVTSDADLEESPLAAALLLVRELDIEDSFVRIALKELRLRKKQFETVAKNAKTIVADTEKQFSA